ncbi:hypothetical protein RI129_011842 [Pyrocoelia pectoralis]|uniref:U2 snRNP-associated SURP motif-containing protein n=1 Tax=Pyrocoelia pectoralis TaxID=417401 RepID=A0AAN7Z844_9COLE
MAEKIKHIPEQKLKAFSIGAMGKRTLSKKDWRNNVFQEFVETFQETPVNEEDTKDRGKLYKPQSRILASQELLTSAERAQAYARMLAVDKKPERLGKRNLLGKVILNHLKKKEREERHKYKGAVRTPIESELDLFLKCGELGSFDNGDPTTTNLYLGNLNPKITEPQLMEIFGRFGPLASIKIMWPRSDEEKARGRNCGFVAYMSRKDGERALRSLNGKDILGYEMKLGWGKSVIIPPHPIYIPPALLELSMPPPSSGLPFNAQPSPRDRDILPKTSEELNQILCRAIVKVVIPTDRNLLMLIHRMVEFVIREGPMFEAMIMNREINNPLFRWKLYSIMHGDSQKEWTSKEFRMFKGGSAWKPPLMTSYTAGMPEELIQEEEARESTKGSLSNTQRDRLEDLIRNLTPEAKKIADAMVFCIEHSEAADEIAECILESLSNESTIVTKKVARLYLISDILHNCGVKVIKLLLSKGVNFLPRFEIRLVEIIKQMKLIHDKLEGRLQAEGYKVRVLRTLKAWEDSIYPKDFMGKLHNAFLGLDSNESKIISTPVEQNWDGNPLQDPMETDEDVPMDGVALLKSALKQTLKSPSPVADLDIDGFEIQDEEKKDVDKGVAPSQLSGFILSKWETVDPEQVEAQAMTTSKWDLLESSADNSQDSKNDNQDSSDYTDPRDMTEERRTKLRDIELKTVQYQDELESGQRKKEWKEKERDSSSSKSEKHKRDWDRDSSEDEIYYKDMSKSRSPPPRKKSSRAVSPPSPPRIRRHSPKSKSHHRSSISPDVSNSKYAKYSLLLHQKVPDIAANHLHLLDLDIE